MRLLIVVMVTVACVAGVPLESRSGTAGAVVIAASPYPPPTPPDRPNPPPPPPTSRTVV